MKEITTLIENISSKPNLLLLLPKEKWSLMLQIGSKKSGISFAKQEIQLCIPKHVNATLVCSEEDWITLLAGEYKLRQYIRLGSTVYKGSFRSLLMLESLLFLQVSTE